MHHPFPRQAPTTHLPSTVHFQAAGKSSQPRPRARGQESRTGIQQESPTRVTFKVRAMSAATSCRVQPGPAKGTSRATSKVQPTSRQSHESSRRHIESSRAEPMYQPPMCRPPAGSSLVGSAVVRITDGWTRLPQRSPARVPCTLHPGEIALCPLPVHVHIALPVCLALSPREHALPVGGLHTRRVDCIHVYGHLCAHTHAHMHILVHVCACTHACTRGWPHGAAVSPHSP